MLRQHGLASSINYSIRERLREVKYRLADQQFLSKTPGSLPIRYFNAVYNVGDLLNIDLINRLTNRNIVQMNSSLSPHLLGVGSIVHLAGRGSHLWGCGIINPDVAPVWRRIPQSRIFALRGNLTLDQFEKRGYQLPNIPLGDPAVLSSHYFTLSKGYSSFRVGIIPHYSQFEFLSKRLANADNIIILNVKTPPQQFIDNLAACQYILSSSLHGLILADAFQIPNKWIMLQPNLFGGDFKFRDYYSTTDHPGEEPEQYDPLVCASTFCRSMINKTSVKQFTLSKKALIDSFPYSL
jgi:pyruvyltransferase